MKVYALGVMRLEYDLNSQDDDPNFITTDERLWALFSSFEEAEKAMLENRGDLFEYHYNVGLIEEVFTLDSKDPNATRFNEKRWWYHAQFTPNPEAPFGKDGPLITKMDCPIHFERTVNFWVG